MSKLILPFRGVSVYLDCEVLYGSAPNKFIRTSLHEELFFKSLLYMDQEKPHMLRSAKVNLPSLSHKSPVGEFSSYVVKNTEE